MASEKEAKYLAKIQGKSAPAVAIEHILETAPPLVDNRLRDLIQAIGILNLGVAASIDEDGSVFLGKGTDDGTNHYIIIDAPESGGGYSYGYANQDKGTGEILAYTTIAATVSAFHIATQKP